MKEEIITKLVQNDSNHNLGQNKIEHQGPIPQIKDEAARRAKRAIFPSMICWGGGRGEGGLSFPPISSKVVPSSHK